MVLSDGKLERRYGSGQYRPLLGGAALVTAEEANNETIIPAWRFRALQFLSSCQSQSGPGPAADQATSGRLLFRRFSSVSRVVPPPEMHALQPRCDSVDRQAADPVLAQPEPERRPELRAFPASKRWEGRQVPG